MRRSLPQTFPPAFRAALGAFVALASWLAPTAIATAQPAIVPIQGVLTDQDGYPVDGTVTLRMRVYSSAVGGTVLHDEVIPGLFIETGNFVVYLGQNAVFDLDVFDGGPAWLGIEVNGGAELAPRVEFGTVPYAAFAGRAATVSWDDVTDVPPGITAYGATSPITLNPATNLFGLGSAGCPANGQWTWSGSAWICQAPAAAQTLTPGNGIAFAGTQVTIASAGCAAGQFSRWTGTAWVCGNDATGINSIAAGNGIGVVGNQVSTIADTCGPNEYTFWNGSAWRCRADQTGTTSIVGGPGVVASQTAGTWTVSTQAQTCTANERSRWNGTQWVCEVDQTGLTSLTGTGGIVVTGTGVTRNVALSPQAQFGFSPIGSIVAWTNHLPGTPALPDGWVRCDGQQISDAASPMNGQFVPNLNGATNSVTGVGTRGRFLRGHTSSGVFESDSSNRFAEVEQRDDNQGLTQGFLGIPASGWSGWQRQFYTTTGGDSMRYRNSGEESRPVNMSVIWIMRVK